MTIKSTEYFRETVTIREHCRVIVTIRSSEHFGVTVTIRSTKHCTVTVNTRSTEHCTVTVTNMSLNRQYYQYVYGRPVSCELLNSLSECSPEYVCRTLVCWRFRRGVKFALNKVHYRC